MKKIIEFMLKPSIFFQVPADRTSIIQFLGPRLGRRYSPRLGITVFKAIIRFPSGVVTGKDMRKSLKCIPPAQGYVLVAGHDFTIEARKEVSSYGACIDLISEHEFFWTDVSYFAILQH